MAVFHPFLSLPSGGFRHIADVPCGPSQRCEPIVTRADGWQMRRVKVFKDRLPSGWSFGLKPSKLEDAIANANVLLPVSLYQLHKSWSVDAPALSATFYPRGSHLGGEDGSFSVSSFAVPSDQRQALSDFSEGVFLPQLVSWMVSIEALPSDSPIKREGQDFALDGSPAASSKRPVALLNKGQRRRNRA